MSNHHTAGVFCAIPVPHAQGVVRIHQENLRKEPVEEHMIFSKTLKCMISILNLTKTVPELTNSHQKKNKPQDCDIQSHRSNPGKPGDPISDAAWTQSSASGLTRCISTRPVDWEFQSWEGTDSSYSVCLKCPQMFH